MLISFLATDKASFFSVSYQELRSTGGRVSRLYYTNTDTKKIEKHQKAINKTDILCAGNWGVASIVG